MKKLPALIAITISALQTSQIPVFQENFNNITLPIISLSLTIAVLKHLLTTSINKSNSVIESSGSHGGIE